MKLNKVLLNIASVFCFLCGAMYIFSLVFIPVGVYCFTAGKRFSYKADHLMDNYAVDKKTLRNYAIFASIACFPFGLLSLIAYLRIYGNNVKVETLQQEKTDVAEEQAKQTENLKEETTEAETIHIETEEEKIEKLEKLRKFKSKGIITEEEFEMAKKQMYGED